MFKKLNQIIDDEFNIFTLFYVLNVSKYLILFFSIFCLLLGFLYYNYDKEEYYSLTLSLENSTNTVDDQGIDVSRIISENFNLLLGMVLSSSATRNSGIELPPFEVATQERREVNKLQEFLYVISNSKLINQEIQNNDLLKNYNSDISLVNKHLSMLTVFKSSNNYKLIFKGPDKIDINTINLIITSGINIILRELLKEEERLKASISDLMQVITDQYFIDLKNRLDILAEDYIKEKKNKSDIDSAITWADKDSSKNIDQILALNMARSFFPEIIKNEIETLKNRTNHEAFIPGKTILKSTFYLIDQNSTTQSIKQSLKSKGFSNDNFKFMLVKSPEYADSKYYKTQILNYLIFGFLGGLLAGIFFALLTFFYYSEKKKFYK